MIFLIEATVFLRGFIFHAAKNIISLSPNRRLVKPTIVAEKRLPQLQRKCVFPKKIQPKHFNYLLKVPFFSLLDVLVAPKIIYSNYSHKKKKKYIYMQVVQIFLWETNPSSSHPRLQSLHLSLFPHLRPARAARAALTLATGASYEGFFKPTWPPVTYPARNSSFHPPNKKGNFLRKTHRLYLSPFIW